MTTDGQTRRERGIEIRKEVLGAEHVERSLARVTEFSRPVQELVTEVAWGDVWSRPELDRRTRSLINLAMLTALNRMHELAVHVRGALRNGCTEREIQEVLLQTAVYCGAPAALESFRVAESVLEEAAELASSGTAKSGDVAEQVGVLGLVGLGNMGGPMARRLTAHGITVRGFDVSAAAQERLAGLARFQPADELGAVADGASVVVLMLPSSDVVEQVLLEDGLLSRLTPSTVLVDMSSSDPMRTRTLAETAARRGIRMIDAPVSGGVSGAENGTLTVMVGGTRETFELVRPVLEVLGSRVLLAGPIGAGHAAKALNNLLSATHLVSASEALLAAKTFGLDPGVVLELVNGSTGRSGSTERKWPEFVLTGRYDSGFSLPLMLKDVHIALDIVHAVGAPSTLSESAERVWAQAANDLPPDADHTEIVRWLEHGGAQGADG